jgi:hypothetical protein
MDREMGLPEKRIPRTGNTRADLTRKLQRKSNQIALKSQAGFPPPPRTVSLFCNAADFDILQCIASNLRKGICRLVASFKRLRVELKRYFVVENKGRSGYIMT